MTAFQADCLVDFFQGVILAILGMLQLNLGKAKVHISILEGRTGPLLLIAPKCRPRSLIVLDSLHFSGSAMSQQTLCALSTWIGLVNFVAWVELVSVIQFCNFVSNSSCRVHFRSRRII